MVGCPLLSRLRRRFAPLRGTQRRCAALFFAPPGRYAPLRAARAAFLETRKKCRLSSSIRASATERTHIWRCVLGRLACQQGRERGIKTPALLALLCVHASALHLQPNNRPVLSQFCGIRRRALAGVYVPPVFLSWSRPQQTPPRELPRCSTGFVNRCVIGSPNATPSTA